MDGRLIIILEVLMRRVVYGEVFQFGGYPPESALKTH
jgi:hypothetical protein